MKITSTRNFMLDQVRNTRTLSQNAPQNILKDNEEKDQEKNYLANFNQKFSSNIMQSLKRMNEEAAKARKASAQARIMLLKQRIEALQQLAAAGSIPPQLIAQLAKELKSLIAQYGGGGGGAGAGSVNLPQPNVQDAPSTATDITSAAEEGAAASTASSDTATAQDSNANTIANAETAATTEASAEDTPSQSIENLAKTAEAEADRAQNAAEEDKKASGLGAPSSNAASKNEDAAFYKLAKELAQKLKTLMAQAREAQNRQDAEDLKKAKKDIEEIDKAISNFETSSLIGGDGMNMSNLSIASYNASGISIASLDGLSSGISVEA